MAQLEMLSQCDIQLASLFFGVASTLLIRTYGIVGTTTAYAVTIAGLTLASAWIVQCAMNVHSFITG